MFFGILIDFKQEQFKKTLWLIEVTKLGNSTEVNLVQLLKASEPITVTELGIFTEVNPVQPEKAYEPISVTEFGIFTDFKLVQPKKACESIPVTIYDIPKYSISLGIIISPLNSCFWLDAVKTTLFLSSHIL